MSRSGLTIAAILLGLAGGALGFALYHWMNPPAPPPPPSAGAPIGAEVLNRPRPAFELADLSGRTRHIREWDGKVIVLNFWATWCPPCKREIPTLIELQDSYGAQGLQVIGVAIDQRQLVQEFTEYMGVNYPVLVGETDATEVTKRYGNRYGQLPFTAFIDREGRIVEVKRGEIEREEAEPIIGPLLQAGGEGPSRSRTSVPASGQ